MSPCTGCHAGCCRSFAVPITGADVLRIESATGLQFWDFVCRWEDQHGLISRGFAPQLFFEDDRGTPFVLCLLHQPSATFPATTKCHFLEEQSPTAVHPQGTARCSIHPHRPHSCRVFPTKLNRSGTLAVLYDIPESGRSNSSDPAYRLCPRPWEPADVDPIEAVQDLVVTRFEMEFFAQVAEVWNRSPGSWLLFPDFLRAVYAQRVRLEEPSNGTIPLRRVA